MTRTEQLERLAVQVELELRAAKAEEKAKRRKRGRPARVRGPHDHGTEQDYQAEFYAWKHKGGPKPCQLCKAAHALRERRRVRGAA